MKMLCDALSGYIDGRELASRLKEARICRRSRMVYCSTMLTSHTIEVCSFDATIVMVLIVPAADWSVQVKLCMSAAAAYRNVIPSTSISEYSDSEPHHAWNNEKALREWPWREDWWQVESSRHHRMVRDGAKLAPTGPAISSRRHNSLTITALAATSDKRRKT
jgi:hypothetical protein